ncbi:disulfide oxidoreductase [Metabacillus herbersteinensis]|uniref:Probable disulfide formation protein n=1 Tax=Metabacillus herbersteinensis TaxID=283816 RepID=A0ABV6GER9_9BACI
MKDSTKKKLENYLFIAWAASLISTLGSLYFSEIMKYIPCQLCWYQRIFMYPLVILLGIAIIKKDYSIALYSLILSAIGGSISIYHYAIQKVPFLSENSISCGAVPCTGEYINYLGFITIPLLALTGFTIIFIMSLLIFKKGKEGR